MSDHIPTTEQVRNAWHDEMFPNASDAAFDRWLAAVEEAAAQRGSAQHD